MADMYRIPLLSLPILASIGILKFLSPFELIAVSLCSRRVKVLCKSIRPKTQCKESIIKHDCLYTKPNLLLKLEFGYFPAKEWCFVFENKKKVLVSQNDDSSASESRFSKKLKNVSSREGYFGNQKEMYIDQWEPSEYRIWDKDERCWKYENKLTVFSSVESISSVHTLGLYLCEVFEIDLDSVFVDFKRLKNREIREIMDIYFPPQRKPLPIKRFLLVNQEDPLSYPKNKALKSVLRRSNVNHHLGMWLNRKPNFFFNFSNLPTFPVELDVIPAHWVKIKHVYNLQSDSIVLGKTRLVNKDFKKLIEKWRSGWTPKWTYLLIKFFEDLDINSYLNENVVEIEDFTTRDAIVRNSSSEFFKFENTFHYNKRRIIRNGYHMVRSFDNAIATVTAVDVNRRIGWFYIQSSDVNAPLAIDIKYERTYSALDEVE